MNIPIISLISMSFAAGGVVVGLAALLVVLWQAPGQRTNRLMAAYMVSVVLWSSSSFAARWAALLGANPTPFLYGANVGAGANAFLLFALISHYTGLWQQRRVRLALLAGVSFYVAVIPTVFAGKLYSTYSITPDGIVETEFTLLGLVVYLSVVLFYLAALRVAWPLRGGKAAGLFYGTLAVGTGILSVITPLFHYSVPVVAVAVASLFFAHAILRENLFNPLAELHRQLAERELRLRTIVTGAPIVLFALDRDGVFTLSEGEGLAVLGLKPGEAVGQSVFKLFRDIPGLHEYFERALAGENASTTLTARGLTFDARYAPLYAPDGSVSGVIGVATDVTERQRAEQTRREVELRYRALFQHGSDAVFILDLEGNFIEANTRAHEMFGYAVGELRGKSFRNLAVEREHSQSLNVLAALKSGQTVPIYERTFRRKDGTEFPTEVNVALVRNPEGNALHIQSIIRDISERKRAEQKFRTLLESAPDAMVIVNAQGEIVLVNVQTQRLFGYAAGELVGQQIEILIPEEMREKHAGHRGAYCASPHSRPMGATMELYARRKDGAQFPVEIGLSPLETEEGMLVSSAIRDISERKRADQALRQSEERFRKIFEEGPLGMSLADLDHRLVKVNNRLCEMLGYGEQELMRLSFPAITHPDDAKIDVQLTERLFKGEIPSFQIEKRYIKKNGEPLPVNLTVSLLRDRDGNPLYALGMVEDITERKRAEEALRESQHFIQRVADASPELIYVFDLVEQRNVYVNREIAEVLGHTPEEIQAMGGEVLPRILHPEELPLLPARLARFQAAGDDDVLESEIRFVDAGGQTRWLYFREIVFNRNPDGSARQVLGTAMDVTERKRAEEALRESEMRYRLVAKATNDVIWDWDLKTNQVFWSEAIHTVLGYAEARNDFDLFWWEERIHPENRDQVLSNLNAVIEARGTMWSGEYRFRRADGSYALVNDRWYFLRDENQNPIRMIGAMADITARKQAEEALRRSEELYRTFVRNFPGGVVALLDRDLRYILVEGPELAGLGYSKEAMEGKTFREALPPEMHEQLEPLYRAVLSGETLRLEMPYEDRIYEVTMLPVRNEQGDVILALSMGQNITARKQAEALLQTERNLLRTVIDNVPDYIFVKDRAGLFVLSNLAHAQAAGVETPEELVGKTAHDVFPADVAVHFHQDDQQVMESGEALVNEERMTVDAEGNRRWVLTTKVPLRDAQGQVIGLVGLSRDISRRKQAEELLRESESASARCSTTRRFPCGSRITHGLRRTLTTCGLTASGTSAPIWSSTRKRLLSVCRIPKFWM